ncbi:PhzF family phenazine biosynthesis protein [Embleya hyalina]|uniref:PhzF family phenazine biosynthesis protein n=1 Tax=Embleya hyalina TaxID=516124 RepID=UPI001FE495D2|nr:PhzF family phenazine biosynthesis isomerase [Embleya hyalina]
MPVAIVHACLRGGGAGGRGHGGSPTAVLDDAPLSDAERRRIPTLSGTSHAVFVSVCGGRGDEPAVSLRFFTTEGELPACGHGTVAALAFLAERAEGDGYRATLHTAGRVFTGRATRRATHVDATFDAGRVGLRAATAGECDLVLPALGIAPDATAADIRVGSPGRSRLLVPVATRSALAALDPDPERLRTACDRLGFLGCCVYSVPTPTGRMAARVFAPSIGVPEDIANANSTACLAAHLADRGFTDIAVEMGDSLGSPATISAGTSGASVHLGGAARVTRTVRLTPG